jgi:hypothetical protein
MYDSISRWAAIQDSRHESFVAEPASGWPMLSFTYAQQKSIVLSVPIQQLLSRPERSGKRQRPNGFQRFRQFQRSLWGECLLREASDYGHGALAPIDTPLLLVALSESSHRRAAALPKYSIESLMMLWRRLKAAGGGLISTPASRASPLSNHSVPSGSLDLTTEDCPVPYHPHVDCSA